MIGCYIAQRLTDEEKAFLDGIRISEADEADSEHASLTNHLSDLQREWEILRVTLQPDQHKPMDELMQMVGIDGVKKRALEIYDSVLSSKSLSPDEPTDGEQRTLNFAFVGNPGAFWHCARRPVRRYAHDSNPFS